MNKKELLKVSGIILTIGLGIVSGWKWIKEKHRQGLEELEGDCDTDSCDN